jgi:alcohol dehydrogenase YqhD (iron-dependent ADH family)
MENFIACNPTRLHFGKNVLSGLTTVLPLYGKRVLLVYGKGSVKETGLYSEILTYLESMDAFIVEYPGIRPNPLVDDVDAAAEAGRENGVDVILAVGGGSVIDSAKIISITIPVRHSGWDFYTKRAKPRKAVPLVAVLTLAATGTEMNPFAVLSNKSEGRKDGFGHSLCYPKESFLDPTLTLTVPKNYTAYGIADLVAHCLELYFGAGDASLSDRFITSIIREAMEYGPSLLENLTDYDLRARIMYAATMGLNGLTGYGKVSGDWGVHSMGHTLSLMYDTPHGASLSIAYPAWLRFFREPLEHRIAALGTELFRKPLVAGESILRIESFFRQIQCPVRLSEISKGIENKEEIVKGFSLNQVNGGNMKMSEEDYPGLVDLMVKEG